MQIVHGSACFAFIFFSKSVETSVSLFVLHCAHICICMYTRMGLPIVKKRREKNIIRAHNFKIKTRMKNEEWRRIKIETREKKQIILWTHTHAHTEMHTCIHNGIQVIGASFCRLLQIFFEAFFGAHEIDSIANHETEKRTQEEWNGNCANFILAGWMRNTHSSQNPFTYHSAHNKYTYIRKFHTCTRQCAYTI